MSVLFFFGAMSPYSWFAAERIVALLPEAEWRPVFAGGLFKASGRVSWGLTDRRAAGLADCEERAHLHGLGPIRWPERWPTSDLLVARAAVASERRGLSRSFSLAAMRLAFLEGADLGELDAVLEAGRRVGLSTETLRRALADPVVKDRLRAATDDVLTRGVTGVPTTAVGDLLFWDDDRLEEAELHARTNVGG